MTFFLLFSFEYSLRYLKPFVNKMLCSILACLKITHPNKNRLTFIS
jgi:hypothetical protein